MTVRELINLLSKCNPNDIVLIDNQEDETIGSAEDVLMGTGTDHGFVYISAYTEEDDE